MGVVYRLAEAVERLVGELLQLRADREVEVRLGTVVVGERADGDQRSAGGVGKCTGEGGRVLGPGESSTPTMMVAGPSRYVRHRRSPSGDTHDVVRHSTDARTPGRGDDEERHARLARELARGRARDARQRAAKD